MRRVNSCLSADDVLLEDLETEGERQLKSLLHHQLDTTVSIEQCKSKRQCFAPAAFYKPFGEEAAGALSLSQFQALQENDKETASLRELGLSDSEILLWKNQTSAQKGSGLGAAPEATQHRLQAIREKITERQQILSLPQRFAGSKQLSRREMEIENALFQGTDRHSFLRALYHQDEAQKRLASEKDPMGNLETVYQEMLSKQLPEECPSVEGDPCWPCSLALTGPVNKETRLLSNQEKKVEHDGDPIVPAPKPVESEVQQPTPVAIKESVDFIPEEEIQKNRLSEEEIQNIPRFASYSPGKPSKVLYLKNLSPRVTARELVSLFARFQEKDRPPIQFRLLNGRMRGQAFITFSSVEVAQKALLLVNGYNLQGKPLVIEFGKNKGQSSSASASPSCCTVNSVDYKQATLELFGEDAYMPPHSAVPGETQLKSSCLVIEGTNTLLTK